jgi:hypothetical protein
MMVDLDRCLMFLLKGGLRNEIRWYCLWLKRYWDGRALIIASITRFCCYSATDFESMKSGGVVEKRYRSNRRVAG